MAGVHEIQNRVYGAQGPLGLRGISPYTIHKVMVQQQVINLTSVSCSSPIFKDLIVVMGLRRAEGDEVSQIKHYRHQIEPLNVSSYILTSIYSNAS